MRLDAGDAASKLSDKRKKIAQNVKSEVENSLKFLDIKNAVFEVRLNKNVPEKGSDNFLISGNENYSFTSRGIDEIEFFISTNIGEDPKPLSKTASGGEISRIMLALKSTLAKNDKLPILIFDEIDTGISGRVAQKVGSVLQSLASLSSDNFYYTFTANSRVRRFSLCGGEENYGIKSGKFNQKT